MGVICDAVDAAIATGLVELGVEARFGEQVLNEGLEFFRGELQKIGPLVDVGEDVDRVNDARIGHAVRHDRLDGDEFVWVRGDVGEEVLADAFDRVEPGLVEDQRREPPPGLHAG